MQRRQSAGEQQRGRDRAFADAPDDLELDRRVVIAHGQHGGDDQRAGVGRGDEPGREQAGGQRHDEHRQPRDAEELVEPRGLSEQGDGAVERGGEIPGAHQVGESGCAGAAGGGQFHVNRVAAEHAQPEEGDGGRHEHHAEHELADGAPARDARDEHADKRRPRQPPAPVEDGPPALPGDIARIRRGPEAHLEKVGVVVAEGGDEEAHQPLERPAEQEVGEHHHRQPDVPLGDDADAAPDAGDRRQRRDHRNHRDQNDLRGQARIYAEKIVQAGGHLLHAEPERGGDAEHRAEHREQIHGVADRAVDAVADHRIQRRAQRQRQPLAEAEIGERQAGQHIERPAVQSPVEIGDDHRRARALHIHRVVAGGRGERVVRVLPRFGVVKVEQRLGDSEEEHADADAGREQHRKPGEVGEFRFGVVRAEFERAEAAEHQVDAEAEGDAHQAHVIPTERRLNSAANRAVKRVGEIKKQNGEDHEGDDHAFCGHAHSGVQPAPKAAARDLAFCCCHWKSPVMMKRE